MTTDDPAATVAAMPAALPNPVRQKIFLYLGVLIILPPSVLLSEA
jgi:hypothetical protein